MPNASIGDRIQVTLYGSILAQVWMSTFVYRITSMTGTPNIYDVYDALDAKLKSGANLIVKYLNCLAPDTVVLEHWYQAIAPARFAKYSITAVGEVGQFAGHNLTANVAAVILRRGDLGNRQNVSTLHVPIGTTDDSIEEGELTNGLKSELQTFASQMNASVTLSSPAVTLTPVINNGPNANDYTVITQVRVKDGVRVMRRRTLRLGI